MLVRIQSWAPTLRRGALAVLALAGLAADPGLAATLAVIDEGDQVFRYDLVLAPDEVVAGIQLDLVEPPRGATIESTGFAVPLSIGNDVLIARPWTLTSSVAPVAGGSIRVAHTYDQGGNPAAGWSDTHVIAPDGSQQTHVEFACGISISLCHWTEPDIDVLGVPVARLRIEAGPGPTRYAAAVCVAAAGRSCSLPRAGTVHAVPEPTAAALLCLAGLLLVARRGAIRA